jgi:nickel-dependent lactate racemase
MAPDSIPPIAIPPEQAECLGTLRAAGAAAPLSERAILEALAHPIWAADSGPALFELVQPEESVCLVVSDHTRKTAAQLVLPPLLRGWRENGCRLTDFFILIASGIHRHPTPDEIRTILGADLASAFAGRIFFHDPDDDRNLVSVGKTSRGHEVRINRRALEADRLILIGAATYHYHAGFGGGRKSLVPGLAARATIAYNHSLTLDPEQDRIRPGVEIGRLDGNPVSEEMLEGARLCRPDAIVNTVLTPDGALAGVFAGDLDLAHRAACRRLEQVSRIDLPRLADFVIASAGGASNWIQSHKALFNASRAVGPEGRIILAAPCPEGLGNEQFRHWVTRPTLAGIYAGLRKNPEVLGQTALSTRLRGARAILVTGLNATDRTDLGIPTAPDLDAAIRLILEDFRQAGIRQPTYYLMPDALALVPFGC